MFNDWEEKSRGLTISPSLLWEYDFAKADWQALKHIVVGRIIERGWLNDYYAGIRLYGGVENFKEIIKELPFMRDEDIDFVCKIFELNKDELKCYTRKQSREQLLNS
ncbi:MAG TPA: hypothetical protein DIC46_09940 [Porphyromonadaceae bacterium]|nr:hypothetical protein [Porphyromonadaceae bacterium]HCM21072.1 hypothetical protein [Porphyromonadaceae bacterium]